MKGTTTFNRVRDVFNMNLEDGYDYEFVTFRDLYTAHLVNLCYPDTSKFFKPAHHAFKDQWMIMLCAMINKPKTVFKLCSHYWFNEVIAIEVTEKLNYLRLFRVLLMRFNPYNAALKC